MPVCEALLRAQAGRVAKRSFASLRPETEFRDEEVGTARRCGSGYSGAAPDYWPRHPFCEGEKGRRRPRGKEPEQESDACVSGVY